MDDKQRFELLANIMRAAHFEWRRAVLSLYPDQDPVALVKRFWEEVGKDTAKYYLKKIDPEKDLPEQVAQLVVASSVAMGEDAEVVPSPDGESCNVRHNVCPWVDWHFREGILEEDQIGCDHWLRTVVDEINKAMGRRLRFETVSSLPGGDAACVRRFWEESES
jgi:hypothetical protein